MIDKLKLLYGNNVEMILQNIFYIKDSFCIDNRMVKKQFGQVKDIDSKTYIVDLTERASTSAEFEKWNTVIFYTIEKYCVVIEKANEVSIINNILNIDYKFNTVGRIKDIRYIQNDNGIMIMNIEIEHIGYNKDAIFIFQNNTLSICKCGIEVRDYKEWII